MSSSLRPTVRVRFHIIRNASIVNVGKSQSCMVSKLRIIWKQTVWWALVGAVRPPHGEGHTVARKGGGEGLE